MAASSITAFVGAIGLIIAGGVTGSGVTGSGVTGSGVTGSGVTGSGVTGPGVTGSGVTGSGVTGSGVTGPRIITGVISPLSISLFETIKLGVDCKNTSANVLDSSPVLIASFTCSLTCSTGKLASLSVNNFATCDFSSSLVLVAD